MQSLKYCRIIIPTILLFLSSIAAITFQLQISQAQQQFPPPITDVPLAADKSYGVTVALTQYSEVELHQQLDLMQNARLTWLRVPFYWTEIEPVAGQFNWNAYDRVVGAAHLRGFKIIAVLDAAPDWARPEGTSPQTPPTEATDFGLFARALAQHYTDEIAYYQIWHEPNLSEHWGGKYVNAADYTLLLKNAAINIRAANPGAKIIAASLAPTTQDGPLNLNEATYLEAMYQAKAAPFFDILGAQLYGFHLPIEPIQADPQLLNIHRIELLQQVMNANGDSHKPVWAAAFGWNALPADWSGRPPGWPADVPEKQRARTEEALDYARANWPWLGPILAPRWDAVGLHPDDPLRGFAIYPTLLPPFEAAAKSKQKASSVGSYPATHPTGQYSFGWGYAYDIVDIPRQSSDDPELPSLTIPFEGTRLDLNINRGDYQGYLWVSIDGQPSDALPLDEAGRSYVVLQDPLREDALVTLARYLPDGPHQVLIEAEGGWGQWAISGWRVYREADTRMQSRWLALSMTIALLSGLVLLWLAWQNRRSVWAIIVKSWDWLNAHYARLSNGQQIGLTFGLAAAFFILPSPVDLLLLPLLGLAFLLRLETGLMVLSFGISFFLFPKSLLVREVGSLELMLAMVTAAALLRLLLPCPDVRQACPEHSRRDATLRVSPTRNDGQDNILPYKLWPRFQFNAADWAALALVALAIVTTFSAQHVGVALYELRSVVIGPVIFYFLIRLTPHLEESDRTSFAQRLVDAFVAGATLHAASALYQYVFAPSQTITAEGVQRAIGYLYGSPNNLSLFLDRVFPILAAVAVFGAKGKRRILYALGLLIVGAALFLTFSKGSLLLAIPAAILFLALMRGGKTAWLAAGSGLIMLAMALFPLSRTERFQNTFSLQPGSTAFFRIKLWQSAWQMLKEHPLTGLGLDNFLYQYRTRYILPEAWAEPDLSHPHNLILDFGTRLGIGGVIMLFWLQGRFWWSAFRKYFQFTDNQAKILLLALMGSMITFLVHGLVDNAFFLVDLAYTFFLSFGIVEILVQDRT